VTEPAKPSQGAAAPARNRSRGRELALKFIFGVDIRGRDSGEDFEAFVVHQGARGVTVDFARTLVAGILEHWERLDGTFLPLARNWKLQRMATIDRNILRLACYELTFASEVPHAVVINEAVELAKKYGTTKSGAFVNGILDRVRCAGDDDSSDGPPAES